MFLFSRRAGYENGITDLYTCLLNVFLDRLQQHGSGQLSAPATGEVTLHNLSSLEALRPDISRMTLSSKSPSGSPRPLDSSSKVQGTAETKVTSGDSDGMDPADNNNCKEKGDATSQAQVIVCNQRNYPVSVTMCTHQKPDALIWDQLADSETSSDIKTEPSIEKWDGE